MRGGLATPRYWWVQPKILGFDVGYRPVHPPYSSVFVTEFNPEYGNTDLLIWLRKRSSPKYGNAHHQNIFFTVISCVNPFRLSYVYIRTKFPNRCDSCTYIYVHGLCDRNMGLLTDTLRYHHTVHTRCSRASGLQPAAILQHVYQRKKSGVYSELSAVFGKFWKITIVGPSSIHRLVWNTTAHYMDFLP